MVKSACIQVYCTSQVAHPDRAYLGFCSMKRLGIFLLPPRWDASQSKGYSQDLIIWHPFVHLGEERYCESKALVLPHPCGRRGGLMVSVLVPRSSGSGSSPSRGTLCCVLGQDTTLTVPPSTQEYKWVPANCWGNLTNCWGVTCDGLASRPGGVEILLAPSCYGNQDKLWPDEPVLAPKASLLA